MIKVPLWVSPDGKDWSQLSSIFFRLVLFFKNWDDIQSDFFFLQILVRYLCLPFVKRLKILNERQKIVELERALSKPAGQSTISEPASAGSKFYLVLLGFIEFYLVLPSFT